ncbi:MAG: hypothetical protein LBM00_07325 [Deltaproteobacteria bacterium]|jgi:hypothetical protein|nr:hypothetical protein [Deltaproteobacteria bacterium]
MENCRDTGVELPDWLWRKQLDGGPGAYDALNPQLRSELKNQIAFLHYYWGEGADRLERRMPWLGRDICDACAPLPLVVYFFDQNYASPSEILAALMPAILAKTPLILACRVGAAPAALPLALSAAFELTGLEQIFSLDIQEAVRLVDCLAAQNGAAPGGMVVFGASDWARALSWAAWERGILCLGLPDKPRIAVQDACKADLELLRWAHPLADIFTFASGDDFAVAPGACHALVSDREYLPGKNPSVSLRLQPGCEALWVWPGLNPAFFRQLDIMVCHASAGLFAQKTKV